MNICGLIGKNIKYSKSPMIHNEYYKEHNIDLTYKIFDIDKDEIENFIKNLEKNNIIGFNITIPYKEYIIGFLDEIRFPASEVGAVNTVTVEQGQLIGYNTDYYGFVNSLRVNNIDLYKKKALILGSGGSAKCVYYGLKELKVKEIHIATRNIDKASLNFTQVEKIININSNINLAEYDIVVNCTPIGGPNYKEISPIKVNHVKDNVIFYDLNYIPEKSRLLLEAEKLGATIINGETMLKMQGYYAIDIWKKTLEKTGGKK